MKKITLLFLSITLFSCSSSDDSNNNSSEQSNPIEKKVKLKSVESLTNDDTENYYYSSNGYVSKMSTINSVFDFDYVDNKMVSRTELIDGYVTLKVDYYYSGDLITKSVGTFIDNSGVYTERVEYSYDNSDKLILEEVFMKNKIASNFLLRYTKKYIYSGDEMIKSVFVHHGLSQTYEYIYKYDDKHNPYYNIYPEAYAKIHKHFKNNVIKNNDYIYEYEYNSNGYPIKSKVKLFTYYPEN